VDCQHSEKYTQLPSGLCGQHAATSSKDKWIGAYSIGLTIPGKLGCPNKEEIRRNKKNG
jgi:hypothetical protein